MILTKELEAEIRNFMDSYWDTYMKGDLQTWAGFLADEYHNIGTTKEELWNSKQDILNYTNSVGDQMFGMAEFRNKQIQIIPYDPYLMVHELGDLYVKLEEGWGYYAPIRLSSLIQKQASGWQVLHQHGSYPDSKAQEGEAFAFDALKAENLKLQEAVRNRTIELEQKNRELEIEAALERIRAKSMAMHKSSELNEVANVLFQQLRSLGSNLWTTAIVLCKTDSLKDEFWFANEKGVFPPVFVPNNEEFVHSSLYAGWKNNEDLYAYASGGEELKAHYDYLLTVPGLKENLEAVKASGLSFPSWQKWHAAYFRYGYLFIITKEDYEDLDIFKRFANVFEQAYIRFLDLQKAEAQARNAEIELGLERVRARAMSMHHSSELADLVAVVFRELTSLGFPLTSSIIWIHDYENATETLWIASAELNKPPQSFIIKPFHNDFFSSIVPAWKARDPRWTFTLTGEPKHEFENAFFTELPNLPEAFKNALTDPKEVVFSASFNNFGALEIVSTESLSEDEFLILHRFGNVFDVSYTRFNDLKKAEASAREAQIEAALERVRSRSLAMHHTDELQDVVNVAAQQLLLMNIDIDGGMFIAINDEATNDFPFWAAAGAADYVQKVTVPFLDRPTYTGMLDAIKRREPFYTEFYSKSEKDEFLQHLFRHYPWNQNSPERKKELIARDGGYTRSVAINRYTSIGITNHHGRIFSDADNAVLRRFGAVLEQSYTRFLDLQKAEAQARESQIQLALERARSQSMTMQRSSELDDTLRVFHEQVLELGIPSAFSFLWLPDENKDRHIFWAAWAEHNSTTFNSKAIDYPLDRTEPATALCLADWKGTEPVVSYHVPPAGVKSYFAAWSELIAGVEELKPENFTEGLYYVEAFIRYGCFGIMVRNELGEDEKNILRRFAVEFESTYTRFLDLQKAEASAREAQIEAALEKIRSRSLAMHKSDELKDVITILFEKLKDLHLAFEDAGIQIYKEKSRDIAEWVAAPHQLSTPTFVNLPFSETDFEQSEMFRDILLAREKGVNVYNKTYSLDEKNKYFHYVGKFNEYSQVPEEVRQFQMESSTYTLTLIAENHSSLWLDSWSGQTISTEDIEVLKRFARVFEQAYTRFLDLKKAEASARESQIEAALERIRTKTMAMKNSEDVGDTVATMFGEFEQLGIHTNRCGILIFDDDDKAEVWTARSNTDGKATLIIGELNLNAHNLLRSAHTAWKANQPTNRFHLEGENIINYYEAINRSDLYPVKFDLSKLPSEEFHFDFFFPDGAVFAFTREQIAEEHGKIMKRFAGVFGQTYRRYLDLQKAEASAKEAIKQAALDRIRADIASMRTRQDLDRITPLIWNELTTLNIPFIRCGIFIMNDELQQIHTFLSNPEGRAIASFNLPYDNSGNIADVVHHWRNNKTYVEHWQIAEFTAMADTLVQLGEISTREQYLQSLPSEGIFLHFVPFIQGMLYVGNLNRLSEDDISLLQSVADAFSTAYARYEDFNKVENTLNDLRQTQKQLVQAEKMASLGELTAGIAHEIQNPLNFVNNFSEVNKDLLEEVKSQSSKVKNEELDDLLDDILQNNEKILQHGKRADAIVKGMLLHTRSSSGAKEPTDINALCDEYLRLAYHGLRAKDNSFNATMKTDFDETIAKIMIIPQDMGRVLLNLINNAFYAVDEKKKQVAEGYEPEVTVSTRLVNTTENPPIRQSDNPLIISVQDNGNGIPQKLLDKIFQPFFTTKPTGQGTGLGLSLSYDIVKAHGGELKVETEAGKGSTFIISLPVNN